MNWKTRETHYKVRRFITRLIEATGENDPEKVVQGWVLKGKLYEGDKGFYPKCQLCDTEVKYNYVIEKQGCNVQTGSSCIIKFLKETMQPDKEIKKFRKAIRRADKDRKERRFSEERKLSYKRCKAFLETGDKEEINLEDVERIRQIQPLLYRQIKSELQ